MKTQNTQTFDAYVRGWEAGASSFAVMLEGMKPADREKYFKIPGLLKKLAKSTAEQTQKIMTGGN